MKGLKIILETKKRKDEPEFSMYPERPTSTYEREGVKPVSDAARSFSRMYKPLKA